MQFRRGEGVEGEWGGVGAGSVLGVCVWGGGGGAKLVGLLSEKMSTLNGNYTNNLPYST